jgi:hypothetical protein
VWSVERAYASGVAEYEDKEPPETVRGSVARILAVFVLVVAVLVDLVALQRGVYWC